MPVGFMCFKGLPLHFEDISALLKMHPDTKVVLDHWGFFLQNGEVQAEAWEQLISLASYPQVHVKVSALFRVSKESWPYADLDSRLLQLVKAYGANRLMWGSDYPFVQQQCGYQRAVTAMTEWAGATGELSAEEWNFIFCGTAESLFGSWPASVQADEQEVAPK